MLVVFGNGKCPICGDFGKMIDKKTHHCPKCKVAFDDFMITGTTRATTEEKYWN